MEDLLDFFTPGERGWEKFDLAETEHLPSESRILEELSGFRFELEDQAQFMNPAL